MNKNRFHLAQANIARLRAPLDDPIMDGFRLQLDRINAIADDSKGSVWRLKTDERNATAIRAYADDRIPFNLSVWESIDALHRYVYRGAHAEPFASDGIGSSRWKVLAWYFGGFLLGIPQLWRRVGRASSY